MSETINNKEKSSENENEIDYEKRFSGYSDQYIAFRKLIDQRHLNDKKMLERIKGYCKDCAMSFKKIHITITGKKSSLLYCDKNRLKHNINQEVLVEDDGWCKWFQSKENPVLEEEEIGEI